MHLEAAQEHLIAPGIEPRGIVFFSKHHDDKTNHDSSTCALFHGLQGTGSSSSFNNPGQILPSGNEEAELSGGSGAVPQIPPLNRIKISASPQGHSAVVTGTPCSPFWKQRGNLMGSHAHTTAAALRARQQTGEGGQPATLNCVLRVLRVDQPSLLRIFFFF